MKLYIKTFGCQMNVHDSGRIAKIMERKGYTLTQNRIEADVLIINTCSVREKPEHKAVSEIGRVCGKNKKNNQVAVFAGCVAQQKGKTIFKNFEGIDIVIGPDHYLLLPSLIKEIQDGNTNLCQTGFDKGVKNDFLKEYSSSKSENIKTYVTVMKGCDERCSYCIVPDVRGPQRSRKSEDIVNEVETVVKNGVKEICLLGQKVNSYKTPQMSFPRLLKILDKVDGLDRIRFTSPHPRHMTPKLINLFGSLPTLCESLHLPVQSGSDTILKKMKRRYTSSFYREVIKALKENCPQILVSTDLIVGFPGETERNFNETLDLMNDIRFSGVFSFMFSPRPGTPAARLPDNVPTHEKKARLKAVHDLSSSIEKEIKNSLIGSSVEVLVEKKGRNPMQYSGRGRNNLIIHFDASELKQKKELTGSTVNIEIEDVFPHSLGGRLI